MHANTDELLNSYEQHFGNTPRFVVNQAAKQLDLILDPGTSAYFDSPMRRGVTVYSAPVLIQTAAVGKNPWDYIFGPIGANSGSLGPQQARRLAPQIGAESMV